ncbi:hypothetical protein [Tenacibaculum xiamenense]|uniref:hypothetical protein n=1 Tax=Tenacibaculum xiamenense TaxID=1261553 RepID=UPI0038950BF8
MGRFTRSTTIPELAKVNSNKHEHIDIQIILINPKNSSLCSLYSKYKKNFEKDEADKKIWKKKQDTKPYLIC